MEVPPLNLPPPEERSVDYWIDKFISKGEVPPIHMKKKVYQEIMRKKADAMESRDYLEAGKYAKAESDLYTYFKTEKLKNYPLKGPNGYYSSPEELKARLKRINAEYDRKKNSYLEIRKNQIYDVKEKQEQEEQNFSEYWKNPKNLSEFSKPSGRLLQLRNIEFKKALLNDFEGAASMKKYADEVEKQETKLAQQRAERAMRNAYRMMSKRHETEVDAIERNTQSRIQTLENQRKIVVDPIQKAIDRDADIPKRQREQPKSACATARYRQYIVDEEEIELSTPRTFRKMISMRRSQPIKKLGVGGLNVDKIKNEEKKRNKMKDDNIKRPRRPRNNEDI